jgi:hypothetical protein
MSVDLCQEKDREPDHVQFGRSFITNQLHLGAYMLPISAMLSKKYHVLRILDAAWYRVSWRSSQAVIIIVILISMIIMQAKAIPEYELAWKSSIGSL